QESFDLAGKILADEPDNIYMQRMQFLNLEKLNQYEQAREYAEKFLNNPKTQGNLAANDYTTYGDILTALGEDTLAAMQFEKAVQVAPEKKDLLKDLSGAYTKAKMYREAADAQQRFVDSGEATTNDIFMLARRYQNAAATEADSLKKIELVSLALKNIDLVLEKVPDNATIILTKARIQFVKNGNKVDQDVVDTYLAALAILDQDPANKTSKKNDYITAYNQIANYYLGLGDTENARLYFEKFLEVDPSNDALRNYLENNLK
ncbi:MAG: tetratricopeptide repeat protein, partial [Muribaculaceae bacterium]